MDDLKSASKSTIYNEESINELIQNLSEHLKLKPSTNSSKCNLPSSNNLSSINQDKTYSPYYSPNNSLSSTASDLIQQQQKNMGMETYLLMQHLLKNGNLIKEAVRRLKFSSQQLTSDQAPNQTNLTTQQF